MYPFFLPFLYFHLLLIVFNFLNLSLTFYLLQLYAQIKIFDY